VLADAPADIRVSFHQDVMTRIDMTFTRPPALRDFIALTEKQFGPADRKTLADTADKTSSVRWKASGLEIEVTEVQGVLSVSYVVPGTK
jgi:hypothetical protein